LRLFIAGATGVLARAAIPPLVGAGHEVVGTARRPEAAETVRALGGEPVTVDLFDTAGVKAAVAAARPDAVLHLATKIPPMTKARSTKAWAENDRLRTETSRHLVDAALDAGAGVYVQEAITFVYPDRGDEWIDEDTPLTDDNSWVQSVLDAEAEAERFTAAGGRGVTLRFGAFYGPDARSTEEQLGMARRRLAPVVGHADGFMSSIHTDDAGSAILSALEAPAGVWNVVDDRPVTRREYADAVTDAFGLKPARIAPVSLTRVVGGTGVPIMARSQRVSNRRFRDATGWAPRHPDAVAGWRAVAAVMTHA
jgi:nucleoside-diphosphate-sugar epimerase